jgi:Exocyst complex component Sec3, C-terminal
MHYFIGEISQQELGAIQGFLRRAEAIYDENLGAYVKLVMRRPMGKILVNRLCRFEIHSYHSSLNILGLL